MSLFLHKYPRLKKWFKRLTWSFLSLLLFVGITFWAIFKSATFQSFITQKIAHQLSKKTNSIIKVKSVNYTFFNHFILNEIVVKDTVGDTLLFLNNLDLSVVDFSFTQRKISLGEIHFYQAHFNWITKEDGSSFLKQFIQSFTTEEKNPDPSNWLVDFENLSIHLHQANFIKKDFQKITTLKNTFTPYDFEITHINAWFNQLSFQEDSLTLSIQNFSGKQKGGGEIKLLKANFYWINNELGWNNLLVETPLSSFKSDAKINITPEDDWDKFIHQNPFNVNIYNLSIVPSEFEYYLSSLAPFNERVIISLNAKGTIDDLKLKDLQCDFGGATSFNGGLDLSGLPDVTETFIFAQLTQLNTNFDDVEALFNMINPDLPLSSLNELKTLGRLNFKGNFTGFIEDFVAYGNLHSDLGSIRVDTKVKQSDQIVKVKGTIDSKQFNLGVLSNQKDFNFVALKGNLSAAISNENKNIAFDGVLPFVDYKGHRYQEITFEGLLDSTALKADLNIHNPWIDMVLNGKIDWSEKQQHYVFNAAVKNIELSKLNLIDRDTSNQLSFRLTMDIKGQNFRGLQGNLTLDSLIWIEKRDTFLAKKVEVLTLAQGDKELIVLNSDWVNGRIEGQFSVKEIVPSMLNVLAKDLPSLVNWKHYPNLNKAHNQFRLMFRIHDFEPIHQLFLPEIDLPDGALFSGRFNDKEQFFHFNFKAGKVAYEGKNIKNLNVYGHNQQERLNLVINSDFIELLDSVGFRKFDFATYSEDNSLFYDLKWDNTSIYTNHVTMRGKIDFENIDSVYHYMQDAEIAFKENVLKVDPSNKILFTNNTFSVNNFIWSGGEQQIGIKGNASKEITDTVQVVLKNFDLENLYYFTQRSNLDIRGDITGELGFLGVFNKPVFNAKLVLDKLTVNEQAFGLLSLNSSYLPEDKKITTVLEIDNLSDRLNFKTLSIKGDYFPFDENKIEFNIGMTNLRVLLLERYLEGIVSDFDRGTLTGNLQVSGKLSEPIVNGEVQLNRMGLYVDYLNVKYFINGQKIYFTPNEINLKRFELSHQHWHNSKAVISGKISHQYFKDFFYLMDTIRLKEFIALDTKPHHNSMYYGRAFLDGNMQIRGNSELTDIRGDIRTTSYKDAHKQGRSSLNLPLNQSDELVVSDFIEFVNFRDTAVTKLQNTTEDNIYSGIALNLNISLNDATTSKIIFDVNTGEEINVRGNGNINLAISSNGIFQMNGAYQITEGDYFFTLRNLISRKLFVQKGSSIRWNGDPLSADLDILTYYPSRSRLSTLVDSNSLAGFSSGQMRVNTRIPVHTQIMLKGSLLQPEITMGVELPDGSPEEKELLITQIIGEDEINRQAFSLLITGQFLPPTNQLLSGASGAGLDNSFQLIEGQINNALGGLFNNLDLGLDYNSGDTLSTAELRLLLGFNYKNLRVQTDYDISNNVGDIEVELRITDELRAKAFHRRMEQNALDNAMNNLQGVGLLYQKTFDSFSELWMRKEE